jgi:hypothetical protein
MEIKPGPTKRKLISETPEPITTVKSNSYHPTPTKDEITIKKGALEILLRGDELMERWGYDAPQIIHFVLNNGLLLIDPISHEYFETNPGPNAWMAGPGARMSRDDLAFICTQPINMQKELMSRLRFKMKDVKKFEKKNGIKINARVNSKDKDALRSLAMPNENDPFIKLIFKKTDNNKWLIGLNNNVKPYDYLDGFIYIHYLLGKPNEYIPAIKLYDLKPKHETASDKLDLLKNKDDAEQFKPSASVALKSTDGETIEKINMELIKLQAEEVSLQDKEYPTAEDEIILRQTQEQIKSYEKYLKKNTRRGKNPKVIDTVSDRSRQNVQKAIIKALNKIADLDPETAKYLRHIETGNDCKYTPDDPDAPHFDLY